MQSPIPAEEERLRNRCWLEAADGRYKGRVYGIGHVDRHDDSCRNRCNDRTAIRKIINFNFLKFEESPP